MLKVKGKLKRKLKGRDWLNKKRKHSQKLKGLKILMGIMMLRGIMMLKETRRPTEM